MRLAVVGPTKLCDQPWLDSHPMQQLKGEGPLPWWLVRVEELDYQREEDLAFGDKEAVVALYKHSNYSEEPQGDGVVRFVKRCWRLSCS